MRIADWTQRLRLVPDIAEMLEATRSSCDLRSIAYEARPVLLAASYLAEPRKTIVVTANYERALAWQAKLALCGINPELIHQLPSGVSSLFEDSAPEQIAVSDRLRALKALVDDEPAIVIASPQAALERTLPADVLRDTNIVLQVGIELDVEDLVRRLGALGYEPLEPVRLPGQFSRRGGILDIFATGRDVPVRIELFGDTIESIRSFDANSQRSIGAIPALTLSPSRETLYVSEFGGFGEMISDAMHREAASLSAEAAARLEELVVADAAALDHRDYFDRMDLYRPLMYPDCGCAIDLLGADGAVVLDEPVELDAVAARSEEELSQALEARADRGEILRSPIGDFMLPPERLASHSTTIAMSAMGSPAWLEVAAVREVGAVSLESYRGRVENFASSLRNYVREGFSIIFCTDQPNRAKAMLTGVEIYAVESLDREEWEPGAYIALGNLGGGFVAPAAKLAIVSDAELFGVARLKLPQRRFMEGAPIATVLDLKPGDFVVHIHFGIGMFRGLVRRDEQGVEKEFLHIDYAPPDKLFVPADQLDRIQKYLNPTDELPKLNKLTGGEWQRTLGKAKEDAREFARDLVKLYAQRKRIQRRPFGQDSPWQTEMESTFPYVETPSQMQAIRDSKSDMTLGYPMDRLVCGDVGFGKTEVAIRAAFKAVQAGRQVAVLCPTTILSEQHYRNFEERLGPFSVRMAIVNRFRTAGERKATAAALEAGTVDIVIGTHALLGQDVHFKDLSLVVIDEEQKFGVKQKEMLKQLRTEVDVLTLSATPIPRTLSMALMDIRQMSLINDPPPGRLPIRTFVRPYGDEVVREAILRELARGGQAFYVYNRVESIAHVAERLRKIVPTARIGVGHGQMTEAELEPIMIGFIKGEIDILLSTTIIENGIDISNANTLIVENAERLGLAQLYQLRGRVGRSDRQAYAYLMYQKSHELSDGAMARLQALQEFSTLGSGYSLAFRDLQIRGAGELLGSKQHGAMANVGYELYTQLIQEAVQQLKDTVDGRLPSAGDEARDPLEANTPLPQYDLPVAAFLPDNYIRDQAQRLFYYQKMMGARDLKTLGEVQAEIEDRYGKPPEPMRRAFRVMSLRMIGRDIGFSKLDAKQGRLAVTFADRSEIPPRAFSIVGKRNRECYLNRENFIWPFAGDPLVATATMIESFADALAQVASERSELTV